MWQTPENERMREARPRLLTYRKKDRVKPAIGRPYVPALVDSGTVPAFTCDCLCLVCAFTRRRYFDLCVTASFRTMLTFENNVSCSSSACSTLASNLR